MTIERHMQSGNMFMWPIEMLTFPFYTGIKKKTTAEATISTIL